MPIGSSNYFASFSRYIQNSFRIDNLFFWQNRNIFYSRYENSLAKNKTIRQKFDTHRGEILRM